VLVGLLVAEVATTPALHNFLSAHIFLGLLLLPRRQACEDGLAAYRGLPRRLAATHTPARRPALRRSVVVATLVAGVLVGLGTYSVQSGWLAHTHHHEHEFRADGKQRELAS
jgi:hypothetical protein